MANAVYSTSDVSRLYETKKRPASFFHLNAQSARNKNDELNSLFSCFNFSFDVIMLTETWYQEESEVLRMTGYNKHCLNRMNKRGGGILLLTRDTLHCDVIEEFCQTSCDYEILTVSCNRYVYSVVYRPPSGNVSVFLAFLDRFFGLG